MRLGLLRFLALATLLGGCGGYPRTLNFGFDSSGRSLNSPSAELNPAIADRYITFISDRNGSPDVYLFDATDRRLINLPDLNSLDMIASHPSVSEDGRYIAFAASRQGSTDIYIYDRETRISRNLTENLQAEVRRPNLSANGAKVAFETSKEGRWDIAVYDTSGEAFNLR